MFKKAFSLFELILVVVLIGLIYSLVLGKITNKKDIKIQNLKNLKQILLESKINKLIVYDRCSKTLPSKINPNIFKNITVYQIKNENLEKIEFNPIKIKDDIFDVCLKFEIFPNLSSSSYIVKKDDKFYVFDAYFKNTKIFKNKEEAINYYLNKTEKEEYLNEN